MPVSGDDIAASVAEACARASAASSELRLGHRPPDTTPSPLAEGAAGPPGRPPEPGRGRGRGGHTRRSVRPRGGQGPPTMDRASDFGTRGEENRPAEAPPKFGLQRPTPDAQQPGDYRLGRRGNGGERNQVESDARGPTRSRVHVLRGSRAAPGPGPHTRNREPGTQSGPGRRGAAGDPYPRGRGGLRGLGLPSRPDTRGPCPVRSHRRALGKPRAGASDDRARGEADPPRRSLAPEGPPEGDAQGRARATGRRLPLAARRAGPAPLPRGPVRPSVPHSLLPSLGAPVPYPRGGGATTSTGRHVRPA